MTTTLPRLPSSGLQAEWPTRPAGAPPAKRSAFAFLRELPALVVFAFILAILIKTFLVQAFFIPSESMVPTLEVNDRVLVNKLAYRFREPRRGEIVVFVAVKDERQRSLPQKVWTLLTDGLGFTRPAAEKDYIKRVIGLPGDTIEVDDEGVFITQPGKRRMKLPEAYINSPDDMGPPQQRFTIPKDEYFVMGDNRGASADSRSALGTIERGDIIGKAFVRIFPLTRLAVFETPGYPEPAAKVSRPAKKKKKRSSASAYAPVPVVPAPDLPPLAGLALAAGAFAPLRRRAR